MFTKRAMLEEASQAGYGEVRQLGHLFVSWQKCGILGDAAAKTSAQGEGLWHPFQREIWLTALRQRREDVHLPTLACLPVGAWLLGAPGIELSQVQFAIQCYVRGRGTNERPAGPRSLRRRGVDALIDRYASHTATRAAKRTLRRTLERILAQDSQRGRSDAIAA